MVKLPTTTKLQIASVLFLIFVSIYPTMSQSNRELSNRQIIKSAVVNQPLTTVWQAWTTHEGLKTFFGKDNKIELVPNGAFEIYFLLDNPAGLRGSEGCKVLSYLPEKYFSFSWNAPPQLEEIRNSDYKTWVVVSFDALSDQQTEVTLTHLGWPKDEKWTPVFEYFSEAWEVVLKNLTRNGLQEINSEIGAKRVTGIGGIFFKCKDPIKLKEWYKLHLGLNTDQYGANFEWRLSSNPAKKGYTQWSPFSDKTKYFDPSVKEFMINYRVENLEQLVENLKNEGVTIIDKMEIYDYGKFIHILDLEGNKIELWERFDPK